jgi:hypothetical protein
MQPLSPTAPVLNDLAKGGSQAATSYPTSQRLKRRSTPWLPHRSRSGPAGSSAATCALTSLAVTRASDTAAHQHAERTVAGDPSARVSAAPLASAHGGSVGATSHLRNSGIRRRCLTDHELYVRHHQRLASLA